MTAESAALLASCIASPAEDGPRMALADHMEDTGLLTGAGAALLRADGHWLIGGSGEARWMVGLGGLISILVPEPHPMLHHNVQGSVTVEFWIVPDPPQCQYCGCATRRGLRCLNGQWRCWAHVWTDPTSNNAFSFTEELPRPLVALGVSAPMSEIDHAR